MARITWLGALGAIVLLGGCARLEMKSMPPAPHTVAFLDGTQFLITRPYRYPVGGSGVAVDVPTGFVTDYASIPAPLRGLFERQGRYSRAALVHDYLYWSQTCSRGQTDNLFWIAMKESGVSAFQRRRIFEGVRVGGGVAWRDNRRQRDAKEPRIVPEDRLAMADSLTWGQARTALRSEGVLDPPFSDDVRVCALGDKRQVP